MHKILVPVDFSPNSKNALHYAFQLFGKKDLEITLLHTVEANTNAFYMKAMDKVLVEDAQEQMDEWLPKLQTEYPNVQFQSKIVNGEAVQKITALADKRDFDYILMGTKGASGLKKVFIGSIAGGVIAKTKAPVIVVPAEFNFQPVKKILFAVGQLSYSSPSVVEPLRKMVQYCQADLEVLHITEEKDNPDIGEQLAPVKDLVPAVHYIHDSDDVNESLNEYITESKTDMLCLVRSQRGFLGRLFNESVTLKQTFDSPVPLLILHN